MDGRWWLVSVAFCVAASLSTVALAEEPPVVTITRGTSGTTPAPMPPTTTPPAGDPMTPPPITIQPLSSDPSTRQQNTPYDLCILGCDGTYEKAKAECRERFATRAACFAEAIANLGACYTACKIAHRAL